MFTVTKRYQDFPASHRQPDHLGHCRLIHGHNWSWEITFGCKKLDRNGFVIDVGELEPLKKYLTLFFDHTLLINRDDPELGLFKRMEQENLVKLVVVDNCGMEGLAKIVFDAAEKVLPECGVDSKERDLCILNVRCWEDSKNSASYNKR